MSEWISVEDRLPEYGKRVLIWWLRGEEDNNLRPVPAVAFGRYYEHSEEWRPVGCMGNFNDEVTHWSELPPPPEK